uniref:Uncharacterized protein n=1 Tax=Anguilla anguilla TaxID=7936 RepID=A0A0E9PA13_ANGAN
MEIQACHASQTLNNIVTKIKQKNLSIPLFYFRIRKIDAFISMNMFGKEISICCIQRGKFSFTWKYNMECGE